jgi:glycosyltransferase involved in cell wall biosynthesis
MKISIIIPIYKAEKWIGRCLDSIFSQSVSERDFEVLCVVDGSPDKSLEILETYKMTHENLIIINQDNQGVSAARNHGIEQSSGDYLLFVDSDDILLDNSLGLIFKTIDNGISEVVVCRAFINENEWQPWCGLFNDKEIVSSEEAIRRGFLHGSVWGCYYNSSFIKKNNIRFPQGVSNGEDNFFFISCLYYANYIRFEDIELYRVIEESNSLSRTFDIVRLDRVVQSLEIMDSLIKNYSIINSKYYILNYIRYTCLSGLVATVQNTEGVGYGYLRKNRVYKYAHFNMDKKLTYLRKNMKLMRFSFMLFYYLSWIKHSVMKNSI